MAVKQKENIMTIEQAQEKLNEIHARTDIGVGQKTAMIMRVIAQARRDNPDASIDDLEG